VPKYRYRCSSCEKTSFVYHHVSETAEVCKFCNASDSLIKIPTMFTTEDKRAAPRAVGEQVKKAIRDYSEDLKEEKSRLKEKIWESDE